MNKFPHMSLTHTYTIIMHEVFFVSLGGLIRSMSIRHLVTISLHRTDLLKNQSTLRLAG